MGWFKKKQPPDDAPSAPAPNDAQREPTPDDARTPDAAPSVPLPAGALSDAEADRLGMRTLMQQGWDEWVAAQEEFEQAFGLSTAAPHVDVQGGTIVFAGADRRVEAVQIIGIWDPESGKFTWGWQEPQVPAQLGVAASRVRAFGERNNEVDLCRHLIVNDEDYGLGYAMLALRLGNERGYFAGYVGDTWLFVTYEDPLIIPADKEATDHGLSDDEADRLGRNALTLQGLDEYERAQAALHEILGGDRFSWSVDLETHTINFWGADVHAQAPVQIVGTYDQDAGTFRWGWADPAVPEQCAVVANRVLAFGKRHRMQKMAKPVTTCHDTEPYMCMALALRIGPASGALWGPTGPENTITFLTYGELRLSAVE